LRNPLVGRSMPYLAWSELRRKAELRLLRIAAHYGATGEVLNLGDPYGASILDSVDAPRGEFWSVGEDGQDHGGDGGKHWTWWRPGPIPGKPAFTLPKDRVEPKDIVIEVPRRP